MTRRSQIRFFFRVAALTIFVTIGAAYAVETSGARDEAAVVTEAEKADFLSYVHRQKIRPASSVLHASPGDVLPDFGVTYYAIPLHYGHPFYRIAAIGSEVVIVDRFNNEVVQVVPQQPKED
jgi:hypothetical protein